MIRSSHTRRIFRHGRSKWGWVTVIALAFFVAPHSAEAEYHIDVGDVLDLSVLGVPELQAHTRVNMDGDISFPLLGELHAAGLTASQLRIKVQNLLAEQVQQRRSPGPLPPPQRSGVNEVTVEISEYRPVYVEGDVAHSSEQTYHPGMTVRQAILLAGGYGVARDGTSATTSSPDELWVSFAREEVQIWRLERELSDQADGARPQLPSAPLPSELLTKIVDAEVEILKTDLANYDRDVSQIHASAKDTELQLDLLADQMRKQKVELDSDTEDFSKIRQLSERHLVTMDRVSAERHQVFLMTTQFLQSSAQLAQLRKERGDLNLRLNKLVGDRHVALVRELQDANIKLALVKERLQTADEKPVSLSTREQPSKHMSLMPSISIFRRENQASTKLNATEDSTLMPGDVIQVSLIVSSEPNVARE